MHKSKNNNFGFTIIETMVIVVIIAILATLGFISFQKYTLSARDAQRVVNITNIQKALESTRLKIGTFPSPEGPILTGSIAGQDLTFVGKFGKNLIQKLNLDTTGTDPSTQNSYTYAVSHNKKHYQIAATKESEKPTYQSHVVGNYKGILRKKNVVYNLPGLIFTGSGELTSSGTFFIVEKSKNIPYKIDPNTPDNSELTGVLYQYLGSSATALKPITIEDWNSQSGSISEDLGYPIDKIGYEFFGEEYLVGNIGTAASKLQCIAVKDSNEGSTPSDGYDFFLQTSDQEEYHLLGNKLIFTFKTPTEGNELWVKDLSTGILTLLKDINPGFQSSFPIFLKDFNTSISLDAQEINNNFFFLAYTPSTGYALWKTNGTSTGTLMMEDLVPGSTHMEIKSSMKLNNKFIFFTNHPTYGDEIFATSVNGTGITLLKNINSGTGSYKEGTNMFEFNNNVFFTAISGTGTHFWKTDGTSTGTTIFKTNFIGEDFFTYNNKLYIFSGTDLWESDGTLTGTILKKSGFPNNVRYHTIFNNKLFFFGEDATYGDEPRIYDFLSGDIELLADILPGNGMSSHPDDPSYGVINNKLIFASTQGKVWSTDGTASGTLQLNISPGGIFGFIPVQLGGDLYFETQNTDSTYVNEIWKTDGTLTGTVKVAQSTNPELNLGVYKYIYSGNLYMFGTDNNGDTGLYQLIGNKIIKKDIPLSAVGFGNQTGDLYGKILQNSLFFTGYDNSTGIQTYYQCKY